MDERYVRICVVVIVQRVCIGEITNGFKFAIVNGNFQGSVCILKKENSF